VSAQKSSIYHVAASSELPADQRYEHWLAPLLSDFKAAAPNARQRQNFQGHVSSLVTATSELHDMQSDDFDGSRSRQRIRRYEDDKLALVYVMQGRVLSQYEGDTDIVTEAGQFLLFDARRPNTMRFCQQPRFVQVNLPRSQLEPVLSGKPLPSQVSRAVSHCGLAGLLSAQLSQFRDLSPRLSHPERLGLLHATEALATHVVESAFLNGQLRPEGRHTGLYTAAQRYIHLHLNNASLNGATIAAALGCSRATLYRAFAAQGLGVAEYLRDLRLRKAYRLLQEAPAQYAIADLAARCGFIDHASFSRLFHRHFGLRPSDIRHQ